MKHGSLFSGIGGFDLAAQWMGWENIFHCERNPFGQKVLKYYWPKAISYEDITKTDFTIHRGKIDILTGGFPCQGYSLAGLRLGTEDARYLWPEMLRTVDEVQPTWIIGENVTGILSMEDKSGIYRDVFPEMESRTITRVCEIDKYEAVYTRQAKMLVNSICEDLEKRGYEVQTFAIPAASVGAPHRRERIWFVAYSKSNGSDRTSNETSGKIRGSNRNKVEQSGERCKVRASADTNCLNRGSKQQQRSSERTGARNKFDWGNTEDQSEWKGLADIFKSPGDYENVTNCDERSERRMHTSESEETKRYPCSCNARSHERGTWDKFPTQSPVCDGNDGLSNRLDGITFSKFRNESIKAGGNAIVPQVIYEIFKAIEQYENLTSI